MREIRFFGWWLCLLVVNIWFIMLMTELFMVYQKRPDYLSLFDLKSENFLLVKFALEFILVLSSSCIDHTLIQNCKDRNFQENQSTNKTLLSWNWMLCFRGHSRSHFRRIFAWLFVLIFQILSSTKIIKVMTTRHSSFSDLWDMDNISEYLP